MVLQEHCVPLHRGVVAELHVTPEVHLIESRMDDLQRSLLLHDRLPQQTNVPIHVTDLVINLQGKRALSSSMALSSATTTTTILPVASSSASTLPSPVACLSRELPLSQICRPTPPYTAFFGGGL